MQTNLKGDAALPLVDPAKGYLACWSPVGGVMGPCLHCARSPYRMRKPDNPFGLKTCWGRAGYHCRDSSQNDINSEHADSKAQFIYVPHNAVEKRANGVVRFDWRRPWFQEAVGLVQGCGDEEITGCNYGYRICAHCVNHGGGNCRERHGKFREGKKTGRGIMKRKYVTRNGAVII